VTIVVLSALAGCGRSEAAKYYLLSSLAEGEVQVAPALGGDAITLGVSLAEYLDRPQIVTRISPNQCGLAEFDLWAEPLGDSLARVLAEDLSRLLGTKSVIVSDWPGEGTTGYRVEAHVSRLDGQLGEEVALVVKWKILSAGDRKVLRTHRTKITELTQGPGYEALVAAENRALTAFSRKLAAEIKTVAATSAPGT